MATPEIEIPRLCEDAALSRSYTPRNDKSAVCVAALESATTTRVNHTDEPVDVNYTNYELPDEARLSWQLDTHRVGGIGQQYRAVYTELNQAAVGSDNIFWSSALIGLAAAICPIGATVVVSGGRKVRKLRKLRKLRRERTSRDEDKAGDRPGVRRLGIAGHPRRPDLTAVRPPVRGGEHAAPVGQQGQAPVVWISWMEEQPVERHLVRPVPARRIEGPRDAP
jgi:hypothetical protein